MAKLREYVAMKNKEFFENYHGWTDGYKPRAISSAIAVLMGGGRLLVRKPDDIKRSSVDVTDVPEGMPFTGGGLVLTQNIFDRDYPFVYIDDLNRQLVELFGIGVVIEDNWVKLCKRNRWESSNRRDQLLYRYPRIVDEVYMHLLSSGESLTAKIARVDKIEKDGVVGSEETLCVTLKNKEFDVIVDDLIACVNWMGDVFHYDPITKGVSIKPRPEEREEEEEEE